MQFFALTLLAASSLVTATIGIGGHKGFTWVRDFDNLVAFGDRSRSPLLD